MAGKRKEKYRWVRAISAAHVGMKRYRRSQSRSLPSFGQKGQQIRRDMDKWLNRYK